MEQKNNRRSSRRLDLGSLLMRMALISFCLVLLSVHLMSGLFAKYSTTATASDSARVAKFKVSATGVPADAINVTYDQNGATYKINVQNDSEVTVKYTMRVDVTGEGSTVTHDFTNTTGTLAPGASNSDATLAFVVDWAKITGSSVNQQVSFTVTIDVEQVD